MSEEEKDISTESKPVPETGSAADAPAPGSAPKAEAAPEPAPAGDGAAAPATEETAPEDKAADPPETAPVEKPEETPAKPDPVAEALEEAARWKDRAARLQADFDNYRKRQAREREDTIRQANADLLEELLPVLDQTDTAIAAAARDSSEAAKPFLEGFELVRRTFLNAVAKFGLKPVESAVGKPLDPATAEALSVMKTGQAEPGCVVFESRKGYLLGGKLLRAAQVVVEQED